MKTVQRAWGCASHCVAILDIPILDVVIITEHDFVSLKDHLSRSFTEPQW